MAVLYDLHLFFWLVITDHVCFCSKDIVLDLLHLRCRTQCRVHLRYCLHFVLVECVIISYCCTGFTSSIGFWNCAKWASPHVLICHYAFVPFVPIGWSVYCSSLRVCLVGPLFPKYQKIFIIFTFSTLSGKFSRRF